MQKRFFEKQIVIKNFKCLGEIFLSRGFLPYVRQTKKIEKSEYDFSIFSLVLYVGTFWKDKTMNEIIELLKTAVAEILNETEPKDLSKNPEKSLDIVSKASIHCQTKGGANGQKY